MEEKVKYDFLIKAIDDTQQAIRFNDTKAGAVIGFWSLVAYTIVGSLDYWNTQQFFKTPIETLFFIILISIMVVSFVASVWLTYISIVPRNNPIEHIDTGDEQYKGLFFLTGIEPKLEGRRLYHPRVEGKLLKRTTDYLDEFQNLRDSDIERELIIELQKVSFIREVKMMRITKATKFIMYFLGALFFLFVYILFKKINLMESVYRISDITINVELFVVLLVGHWIADYLLQTDYQARQKTIQWNSLLIHCLIYTFVLSLLMFFINGYFNWATSFLIFISHVVIDKGKITDMWAKKVKRIEDSNSMEAYLVKMQIDQVFHYSIIFIIALFAG